VRRRDRSRSPCTAGTPANESEVQTIGSSEEEDDYTSTCSDVSMATNATTSSRKRTKRDSPSASDKATRSKTRRTISVEERDVYARAEAQLIKNWSINKGNPAAKALMGQNPGQGEVGVKPSDLTVQEMGEQVEQGMAQIREISHYKKGVSGTTQKALREIAALTESAFKEVSGRSRNEEVRRLQAANTKLRSEVDLLREELRKIKQQLANKNQCGGTVVEENDSRPRMVAPDSAPSKALPSAFPVRVGEPSAPR
jgi:hypothetical protein